MQNGSSRSKKFIKIPGEEIFIHTFKFNTNLPLAPIPYAKTLYYPLDAERYSKPKLTSFHLRNAAPLLVKCDLGIPVDEINMKSYLYNGSDFKGEPILAEEDEMIINENIIKAEKEEIKENLEESDKNEEEDEEKNENSDNMEGNELDFSPTKYKAKINENDLKKIIDKTFEDINLVKNSLIHPTKPGVISRKVYDIIPNFHDYNVELICIGDENLKSKLTNERYIIKTVIDDDKQEIFKVYDSAPMISIEQANISDKEEENLEMNIEKENDSSEKNPKNELFCKLKVSTSENSKLTNFETNREYEFRHVGNFMFTKALNHDIKRDYLLSFNKDDEHAFLYELKANFFMRKNKYTEEGRSGRQHCVKLNIENMNKSDLIEMKAKLEKINIKTEEIQNKIENCIEQEEIIDKNEDLNWNGSESENEKIKDKDSESEKKSSIKDPIYDKKITHTKTVDQKINNEIEEKNENDSDADLFEAEKSDEDDNSSPGKSF